MYFPVAGVEVNPMIPPLVAFVISLFTSMGGVSGAFLILPFQVSILGFTSPAVSPTNLIFNIVAIPGGVLRYIKERRMAWPLTWVIIIATLPGVVIGAMIRIKYLPDPAKFKFFVGCVLAYIGIRLFLETLGLIGRKSKRIIELEKSFQQRFSNKDRNLAQKLDVTVKTITVSLRQVEYEFYGQRFSFNPVILFLLCFLVGIVGGTYGIGGGAIIAPFLIAIFRLPVYTIAGAALMATFLTSIIGVATYSVIADTNAYMGLAIQPDWLLGFFFGIGGLAGTYTGARLQKQMPAKTIKIILALSIMFISSRYIWGILGL